MIIILLINLSHYLKPIVALKVIQLLTNKTIYHIKNVITKYPINIKIYKEIVIMFICTRLPDDRLLDSLWIRRFLF